MLKIAEHCTELRSLNVKDTCVTDDGLKLICRGSEFCLETRGCDLERLVISFDVSLDCILCILRHMTNLCDFHENPHICHALHILATTQEPPPVFKLRNLTVGSSESEDYKEFNLKKFYPTKESLLTYLKTCPNLTKLCIIGIPENYQIEAFSPFQIDDLTVISNTFFELVKVLPIIKSYGKHLTSLSLGNCLKGDIVTLGKAVPRLESLRIHGNGWMKGKDICNEIFTDLNLLSLEGLDRVNSEPNYVMTEDAFQTLCTASDKLETIEFIRCEDFRDSDHLKRLFEDYGLFLLSTVTFTETQVTLSELKQILFADNCLFTIEVSSCPLVHHDDLKELAKLAREKRLDYEIGFIPCDEDD